MKKIYVFEWAFAVAVLFIAILLFRVSWTIVNGQHTDPWGWSAIEAIGTWAGAFATAAAVIIALWTARKSDVDQRRRDDVKARLTALRYSKDLLQFQSQLSMLLKWAREQPNLQYNAARDMRWLELLKGLTIDPPFDDLYLLAPLPDDFAIRVHNLASLFESVKREGEEVKLTIKSAYDAQLQGDHRNIAAANLHLSLSIDSFGNNVETTRRFVDRLVSDSLREAYSEVGKNLREPMPLPPGMA